MADELDHAEYLEHMQQAPCSYPNGYADDEFYCCLDCGAEQPAVLCEPCAIICHKDHRIQYVGDKRHMRCDCGTKRCSVPCEKLKKEEDNTENKYHRLQFSGKPCFCQEHDDELLARETSTQCLICENLFHLAHIGKTSEVFEDYICRECARETSLMFPYVDSGVGISIFNAPMGLTAEQREQRKEEEEREKAAKSKKRQRSEGDCAFRQLGGYDDEYSRGRYEDIFLTQGWRKQICRCSECVELFTSKNLGYLLLEEVEEEEEGEISDAEPEAAEDFDINTVEINSEIEARDSECKWYAAIVIKKSESSITIHYEGWSPRYDEVFTFPTDARRLRKRGENPRFGPRRNGSSFDQILSLFPFELQSLIARFRLKLEEQIEQWQQQRIPIITAEMIQEFLQRLRETEQLP